MVTIFRKGDKKAILVKIIKEVSKKKQFWSQLTERSTKESNSGQNHQRGGKKSNSGHSYQRGWRDSRSRTDCESPQISTCAWTSRALKSKEKSRQVPCLTCFWSSRNKWVVDSDQKRSGNHKQQNVAELSENDAYMHFAFYL